MVKIDFRKMVADAKTDADIDKQDKMIYETEKQVEKIIKESGGSIILGCGVEIGGFETVAVTIDTVSSVIEHDDGSVEQVVIFELIDNGHFIDIPLLPAHDYIEISHKRLNETDSYVWISKKRFQAGDEHETIS